MVVDKRTKKHIYDQARYKLKKELIAAQHKEYYETHKEETLAACKKWREENQEKIKINRKAYNRNNPEKVKAQKKKYFNDNRDRLLSLLKKWNKENPDKKAGREQRRRARKINATVEYFTQLEIYERDKWVCQLCKKKVDKKLKYPDHFSPSLDHIIPLSNGGDHSKANTQLTHLICNIRTGVGGIKQPRLF